MNSAETGRGSRARLRREAHRRLARGFAQLEEEIAASVQPPFDSASGLRRFTAWLEAGAEPGAEPGVEIKHDDVSELRGGPFVMRALLGARLRRIREGRGITADEAGRTVQMPEGKLVRVELGRTQVNAAELAELLVTYEVSDRRQWEILFYLAAQSTARRWWHNYAPVLPGWFKRYIELEEGASLIRTYQVERLPGLLQTADYARAVTILNQPHARVTDVELRVKMLEARQAPLTGRRPLQLWAVIDEAVLNRPVGDANVMRNQLRHLLWMSSLPNVTIQVVPLASGVALPSSFSILRYADPDLPDVVYVEHITGALYLSQPGERDHYSSVMLRLSLRAALPSDSAEILRSYLSKPYRASRASQSRAALPTSPALLALPASPALPASAALPALPASPSLAALPASPSLAALPASPSLAASPADRVRAGVPAAP